MKNIHVINGPNLNMLGRRDSDVYGNFTLSDIESALHETAGELELSVDFYQSNSESELVDYIQALYNACDGIIINAGALSHYSYAIRDALELISVPVIEVHISNVYKREEFRHKSVLAPVCTGLISGLGYKSYLLALRYFIDK